MTPFVVATSMSGISRPSYTMPSADTYAKAAVATIGVQDSTYGCFSHAMQVSHGGGREGSYVAITVKEVTQQSFHSPANIPHPAVVCVSSPNRENYKSF